MEQPQAPATPPPIINQTPPPVANPAPVAPAPGTPAPQQVVVVQAKSTPVWAWLLGGCFGIILLTMLAIGGFTWWAAYKIKNEFKNAQPKLEQWKEEAEKMSKEAEEWQKESDKWQEESEKIRNQMPDEIPME